MFVMLYVAFCFVSRRKCSSYDLFGTLYYLLCSIFCTVTTLLGKTGLVAMFAFTSLLLYCVYSSFWGHV